MAESRPELLADLAAEAGQHPARELDLLTHRFGRLRFVHLRRLDVVGQAVSWAKSLQTRFWHPGESIEPGAQAPQYDKKLIENLVDTIEKLEADWSRWFKQQQVTPFEVIYEQLATDPVSVARQVLNFLDLEVEEGRELVVRDQRQADEVNAQWIERFKSR